MPRFPSHDDDLHLPILREEPPETPAMSLDEYETWLAQERECMGPSEYERDPYYRLPVPVPFRLVDEDLD